MTSPADSAAAECMFMSQEKMLGICDWDSGAMKIDVPFIGMRRLNYGAELHGDAYLNGDFGVSLDGVSPH